MNQVSKPAPRPDPEGIVFVEADWDVEQTYRPDPLLAELFGEMKHGRLAGSLVPGADGDADRVIFPPQSFCEITFRAATGLVPVGPGGTIRAMTVVQRKFANGLPPPYVIVFVQLDGADTAAPGYLRNSGVEHETNPQLIGARCRAVFRDEPTGDWTDFWYELEDARTP